MVGVKALPDFSSMRRWTRSPWAGKAWDATRGRARVKAGPAVVRVATRIGGEWRQGYKNMLEDGMFEEGPKEMKMQMQRGVVLRKEGKEMIEMIGLQRERNGEESEGKGK